mmetsp:Transcript_14264/g.25798  ORF Transcript_14264/g.25798 Transcript_14264/m.25798 type:complete len:83 (-) Transcript_14264:999-1247(-)
MCVLEVCAYGLISSVVDEVPAIMVQIHVLQKEPTERIRDNALLVCKSKDDPTQRVNRTYKKCLTPASPDPELPKSNSRAGCP